MKRPKNLPIQTDYLISFVAVFVLVGLSPSVVRGSGQEYLIEKSPDCNIVQTSEHVDENVERVTDHIVLTETSSKSVRELRNRPCVISVERNHTVQIASSQPNDPQFDKQWSLKNSGQSILGEEGQPGIDIGYTDVFREIDRVDTSTTVAVIDTGVNEIDELSGKLTPGKDFLDTDTEPADENGHGTAMASVIAAHTNNNTKIAGINNAVEIMPVRVLQEDGRGKLSNLIKGIDYAVENNADIINLSLVSQYSDQLNSVIEKAHKKDVIVVGAAGNSGIQITDSNKRTPVSNEEDEDWIIGVGGHGKSGSRTSSSNYGTHVDVLAPGEQILTLNNKSQLEYQTGTSISAAMTAGVLSVWDAIYEDISPQRAYSLLNAYKSHNRLDIAGVIQTLRYPDGTLIRSPESGVYLLENGKKRPIPHPSVFLSYDYKWENIVVTNPEQLSLYPTGERLPLRDGSLVADQQSVYVIEEGTRRPIKGPDVFLDAGYDWEDVRTLPSDVINAHPTGAEFDNPNYVPNGSVVYSPSSSGVFLIENDKKRPFFNPDIFLNRYGWDDTVQISDEKLAQFEKGDPVLPRSGSLLADESRVYIVDGRNKRPVLSAEVFLERGYAWGNVKKVGRDTLNLLETGALIK